MTAGADVAGVGGVDVQAPAARSVAATISARATQTMAES